MKELTSEQRAVVDCAASNEIVDAFRLTVKVRPCDRSKTFPAVSERRKATTGFMPDCRTPGRWDSPIGATVKELVIDRFTGLSRPLKTTGLPCRTFEQQIPYFWKLVEKRGACDCWLWKGSKHKEGYGRWRFAGKFISAHRYSFILHYGEIPSSVLVCHTCDNPPCCNPDHLFLGTKKDNADDRDRKGRNINRLGDEHGNSKLTAHSVRIIRSSYRPFIVTSKMLARRFGVSQACIKFVLARRNWRHI